MWWWGEQEAPGLEKWLQESVALYKDKSGNDVEMTLQDNASVIPEFQTASAAKNAPDIQFLWNGIYHMESVWLDYLEPLDGLIPEEILKGSGATALSTFDGKQYRIGWYSAAPQLALQQRDVRRCRPRPRSPTHRLGWLAQGLRER